jgi:asparaginyl-tRNA synthetase
MRENGDDTVAAFDILLPNIGEVIGGSQREERMDVLKQKMDKQGMKDIPWFTGIRKFGSVPHSGFGLGFDRFVRFITGMHNIRDVSLFYRAPGCLSA